jgi:hypothetical protein
MLRYLLFTIAVFVNVTIAIGQPTWFKNFSRIKVLETSRLELESLMGKPEITFEREHPSSVWVEYSTKDWKLTAFYSSGNCSANTSSLYDVPRGILTSIDIDLEKPVSFDHFRFDLSTFKRSEIEDIPGVIEYIDLRRGLKVWTNEFRSRKKQLRGLDLFPTDEQDLRLECPQKESTNGGL